MVEPLIGAAAQRLLDAATPGELAWESVGTQDNEWCIGVTDPEVSGQIVEPYDEATGAYGELPMVVESLAFNGINATFADAEMFCAVKRALRQVVALEAENARLRNHVAWLAFLAADAAAVSEGVLAAGLGVDRLESRRVQQHGRAIDERMTAERVARAKAYVAELQGLRAEVEGAAEGEPTSTTKGTG
jgi:regulator of protease activity HflC (stomatin/prohibitin superfamily)